ncbi:MFS transporter [Anaerovorax odorimutans]|uniref:MFS transporter n=1 Tax=Anaerovorax odorimutans TaxID=109327 RepID=UPI0003FD6352|nr:MFS transporter [Anaerovorax odorimutans]
MKQTNENKNNLEINNSPTNHQLATLFVVIITSFITTFTGSALNLSIPTIGTEFHASASFIGWIITGYMLASATLSVPFGRISDLTNRKRILVIGILIFALCSCAAAFAWSIKILLLFRIVQGIGAAMIFSTNTAVLISAFPSEKRGKVLGYSIASTYIGLSAGPVIGGMLNHHFGWRSIFTVTFLISITVFIIAIKYLPKSIKDASGQGIDFLGNILYMTMIVTIMYGFSSFTSVWFAKYLIISGVVLFILFVMHELKTKYPIIEVRLFAHNISYTFSNIAALLNYGATFALGYLLSIYLQLIMGFDSQISGLILISQPLLMAVLSPYAGKLSDKISPFKLASFGMALCALGLFSFIFISKDYPLWLIIVNLIVMGVGFAFFSSPNTNAVMACVEKENYGVASSILATMRSIGHTSSMAVVTFIVALKMDAIPLAKATPEMLISTMHISFIVFTCVCTVGIFISLKRKNTN